MSRTTPPVRTNAELARLLPWPAPDANKYTRGKLCLVAGSAAYPGAARLAGTAAERTGAGYTEVYCAGKSMLAVRLALASLVVRDWRDWRPGPIAMRAGHPIACALGSGFDADDPEASRLLMETLRTFRGPLLVDGGALGLLGSETGLRLASERAASDAPLVLTPHGGEAARLARAAGIAVPESHEAGGEVACPGADANGRQLARSDGAVGDERAATRGGGDTVSAAESAAEADGNGPACGELAAKHDGCASTDEGRATKSDSNVAADKECATKSDDNVATQVALAEALAEAYHATVVLKGPITYIASPGETTEAMDRGTAALAKAGTGDVLAGIIGALLAQGLASRDAAALGCALHAEAGRAAADALTAIVVTADDLPAYLPQAIHAISGK